MNDQEFDALINKIQNEVFTEAKDALGEKGFDRWRNPMSFGMMEAADSHARLKERRETGIVLCTIPVFL